MFFHTNRFVALVTLFVCLATPARADVIDYVKIPDKEFRWEVKSKTAVADGTVYDLELISQVWHGITWQHQLQVFLPKDVKPGATMFLYNQGGKASPLSMAFGMDMAKKIARRSPSSMAYPTSRSWRARPKTPSSPRRLSAISTPRTRPGRCFSP